VQAKLTSRQADGRLDDMEAALFNSQQVKLHHLRKATI